MYLWSFLTYGFLGYLLEKVYALVTRSRHTVRKGYLLLPVCPVYGLAMLAHSHEEGAPQDEGEVYAFYMHPSVWGTPATNWAFLFCLQRLKNMGYRSAVVWVLEENRRARRFYEKYGFSSEGV